MTDPITSDVNARFAEIVAALADRPGVTHDVGGTSSKRFGSTALKVDGKMFAMLVGGRLVVKLPKTRVDALVADGRGTRFDPGSGRVMREWVTLAVDGAAEWDALAVEALAFVSPRG